jgi:hydrogenase maturation protease
MADTTASVLVIGYGNPGRLDDGLGPRLAEAIAAHDLPAVQVESNYQLNVEDAALLTEYEVVVFADAHVSCADPFIFERLEPAAEITFTTHSVAPASLLALAQETFDAKTIGFVLGMRGHEFNEFGETLSAQAEANLQAAIEFLLPLLRQPDTTRFLAACDGGSSEAACQSTVT